MNRLFTTLASVAVVAVATPALAHARLVAASPASGAMVSAPQTVSLTFSERVAGPFSTIEVINGQGRAIAIRLSVSADGKTLHGTLDRPLGAGVYEIRWGIAAADGHRMTGSYSFTVR